MQHTRPHIIVIYGAPAVGKLTVASHLSEITGYKVLHNHMTSDLVTAAIGTSAANYWQVVSALRLILVWAAVKNGQHLIVTGCYSPTAKPFYRQLMKIVEKGKGECTFIHLTCNEEEMYRRVTNPSRQGFAKTQSVAELKKELCVFGLNMAIPFAASLHIDNTTIPPATVAMRIAQHCGLICEDGSRMLA